MPVYTHPDYTLPLPEKHTFPMQRYRSVERRLLERARDAGVLDELEIVSSENVPLCSIDEIERAHCSEYIRKFAAGDLDAKEQRAIGFPWSDNLVRRTWRITGATVSAMRDVLEHGYTHSANLAGGTHHAFRAHGEGFCIVNDIAVATRMAQHEHGTERTVVVDLDVHQGNGTASIFLDDPGVFTFSLHGENNYPWKSRVLGSLDIGVADDVAAPEYLDAVSSGLARIDDEFLVGCKSDATPPLVFFQAGVDPLAEDRLGRLSLTRDDLCARNALVFDWCARLGAPCVITMGGGYSRPIEPSVEAHVDLFLQASAAAAAARGACA